MVPDHPSIRRQSITHFAKQPDNHHGPLRGARAPGDVCRVEGQLRRVRRRHEDQPPRGGPLQDRRRRHRAPSPSRTARSTSASSRTASRTGRAPTPGRMAASTSARWSRATSTGRAPTPSRTARCRRAASNTISSWASKHQSRPTENGRRSSSRASGRTASPRSSAGLRPDSSYKISTHHT